MGWRFWATRANGDGTETPLAASLPLSDVTITTAVSNPTSITFRARPEIPHMITKDGRPIFEPWSTIVYAETDGLVRAAGIVAEVEANGHDLSVECVGFSAVLNGQPWTEQAARFTDADPGRLIALIWERWQAQPAGNVGLDVPTVVTPARVGKYVPATKDKDGQTVEAVDERFALTQWDTHDLGDTFGDLLQVGSIDYREHHEIIDGRPRHRLIMAHPRLGRRRRDLRFVPGVNVDVPPVSLSMEDYASEVLLLGAGEGEKMVTGHATAPTTRLRRVAIQMGKHIGRKATAETMAARRARQLSATPQDVETLRVFGHPNAPLMSWDDGDEVQLVGHAGWAGPIDVWVRILETEFSPTGDTDTCTVKVALAGKG